MRRALLMGLVLGVLAVLPTAQAQNGASAVLVSMTTADERTNGMAFRMADEMLEAGREVVLLLSVRAVDLADADAEHPADPLTGLTPRQRLADLMAGGAVVYVCQHCSHRVGLEPGDLIEGVRQRDEDLQALMLAPDTRILWF